PLSNSFETLVFFSWVIAIQYIIVEIFFKLHFLGACASLFALIALAYSTLFPSAVKPLMPALQNNFWLTVHVILCFISYASFALSFIAALLYLVRKQSWHQWISLFLISLLSVCLISGIVLTYLYKREILVLQWNFITLLQICFALVILSSFFWFPLFVFVQNRTWATPEQKIETFIYKAIALGFPFLAMGILSGSVWANKAWGRYWGWDPKETWSLITWLIYAFYLHARFVRGWKGIALAWCAVIGFLGVLFTYFGVNYLLTGLHSYA
ncbi:MAG: c-type cytochrome biogenesis protein CcsB, partial [Candidatus Brocadiae bacterium]|nr:c-type cytochrome biogenesis protein CcsB [Candidatus Brocadiia bacterium]